MTDSNPEVTEPGSDDEAPASAAVRQARKMSCQSELYDIFKRYDLDHNGVITLNEAQWALQNELNLSPQTALRLLNQFVKLDYQQFISFYSEIQKKKLEIYEKFGRYDRNQDGFISSEEAHQVLQGELGYTKEKSEAMVRKFDLNKDGQVSYLEFAEFYVAVEEKKAQVMSTFRRFDPEGVGFIPGAQACQALQQLLGFSKDKAQVAVERFDKNGDGNIDYQEFLTFYSTVEEERYRLLSEFDRYDTNHDGRISEEEFSAMLKGQGYTEREISTLMAGYDTDNKGYLTFSDFRKYLNFT